MQRVTLQSRQPGKRQLKRKNVITWPALTSDKVSNLSPINESIVHGYLHKEVQHLQPTTPKQHIIKSEELYFQEKI